MIIGTAFSGDSDTMLMEIQRDEYRWTVDFMFQAALQRYGGQDLERTPDVLCMPYLHLRDHRPLQVAHDILAAIFRYFSPGLRQLSLNFEGVDEADRLRSAWRRGVQRALPKILEDRDTCSAIVLCVLKANTDAGLNAERELQGILVERYVPRRMCGLGYPLELVGAFSESDIRHDAQPEGSKVIVTRATAERVALREVRRRNLGHYVAQVLAYDEISWCKPGAAGYGMPDLTNCWIAYVEDGFEGIHSSVIVAVARDSGAVVWAGSACDEG